MTEKAREPSTPEEWQLAVDAAEACLMIDSARQYGLVTGGPRVNAERCIDIVERGRKMGYKPSKTCLEEFLREYQAMCEAGEI